MSETNYRENKGSADAQIILKALLEEPENFVSGSRLAEQLGISRPAIHGKLDKLRDQGFEIEATRNKGYRITKEPEIIHPDLVTYYTKEEAAFAPDLLYFPVIDSTNSEAERQLSFGRKSPFAILSSCQTKGRGRLGRDWHSASADNLYLSVVFEPNIPPQALQHFTLWAGIHICRALQSFTPNAPLQIKWPNDLHCHDRKFAGMLTEAKMDADRLRSIIFGIGLNVNSNPNSYPSELIKSATSLYAVGGRELPLNQIAARVIKAVNIAYDCCILEDGSENLVDAWGPLSSLSGKPVTALMGENAVSGIASGIDETGALLLRQADGSLTPIRAGDVTIKK